MKLIKIVSFIGEMVTSCLLEVIALILIVAWFLSR